MGEILRAKELRLFCLYFMVFPPLLRRLRTAKASAHHKTMRGVAMRFLLGLLLALGIFPSAFSSPMRCADEWFNFSFDLSEDQEILKMYSFGGDSNFFDSEEELLGVKTPSIEDGFAWYLMQPNDVSVGVTDIGQDRVLFEVRRQVEGYTQKVASVCTPITSKI